MLILHFYFPTEVLFTDSSLRQAEFQNSICCINHIHISEVEKREQISFVPYDKKQQNKFVPA
jgi:hypothetical protein